MQYIFVEAGSSDMALRGADGVRFSIFHQSEMKSFLISPSVAAGYISQIIAGCAKIPIACLSGNSPNVVNPPRRADGGQTCLSSWTYHSKWIPFAPLETCSRPLRQCFRVFLPMKPSLYRHPALHCDVLPVDDTRRAQKTDMHCFAYPPRCALSSPRLDSRPRGNPGASPIATGPVVLPFLLRIMHATWR